MSKSLAEKGLEVAKSYKNKSDVGKKWLDRTVYHVIERTDAQNRVIPNGVDGEPVLEIQARATQGRWLTPAEMEEVLAVEKEHMELNLAYRAQMKADNIEVIIPQPELQMTGASLI